SERLGARHEVAQQTEPFRAQLLAKECDAGDIAARPAQISDESLFHRICTRVEYHGNCGGRVLPCLARRATPPTPPAPSSPSRPPAASSTHRIADTTASRFLPSIAATGP